MKVLYGKNCLGSYDLASYLSGIIYANEKQRIEQHLCVCDFCFDAFIDIFNQHLSVGEVGLAHDELRRAHWRASPASFDRASVESIPGCSRIENSGAGAAI